MGAFQGVRVEAKVELGLEQRRWMVGHTGEVGDGGRGGAAR
jgi:hypothetical protein